MKRDWKKYNQELVRGGELFELGFLESWSRELEAMNHGKRGKPFAYPTSFVRFLASVRLYLSNF